MDHNQKLVYEQIQDDQDHYQQSKRPHNTKQTPKSWQENTQQHILSNQQKLDTYDENSQPQHEVQKRLSQQIPVIKSFRQSQQVVDHQELGKYANLEDEQQDGQNIKISITKSERKGGLMSYYYVYIIEGSDTKGNFTIARRFNEFYEMRAAMITRWPGCFVPSIPAKNALNKNDVSIIKKRTRYLNDFVKKLAKLPHLYYGEQFQTLLRSQASDVSEKFTKWPAPTSQSIINKYRVNFSQLAGKELNFDTTQKINDFSQLMKKNQTLLVKERQTMKNLAESYDKVISSYGCLFTTVFPVYQKECFAEYCGNKEDSMLYMNASQIKLQQHTSIVTQATSVNPFWTFYDLIRHQERDAMAFSEVLEARSKYEAKKHSIEIKISENEKSIAELSLGKKPLSALTSRGTNEEIKYKLEVENEQLKRQKQNVLIIGDIMSAMVSYIEIERYKKEKQSFYIKALAKIGSNQITSVQNMAEIWNGAREATQNKLNQLN